MASSTSVSDGPTPVEDMSDPELNYAGLSSAPRRAAMGVSQTVRAGGMVLSALVSMTP